MQHHHTITHQKHQNHQLTTLFKPAQIRRLPRNRKLKNYKLQLYINHAVTRVQQPVRKIPLHTRKKVEKELQRLLDLDIIGKVNWPNKLVKNPIVPIPKTDQTI